MDRLVPPRRDRTIQFELPRLEKPEDAVEALASITAAVSQGEVTPSEAFELAKTIDVFTRALEAHDLSDRIAALETIAKETMR